MFMRAEVLLSTVSLPFAYLISAAATVVICLVWWMNGSELEDAWLYAFGIFIVLMPAVEAYFKK